MDSMWEAELKNQAQQQNVQAAFKELTLLNDYNSKNVESPSQNSVNQSEIDHLLSTQYSTSSQLESSSKKSDLTQSFHHKSNNQKFLQTRHRYQHDLRQRHYITDKKQLNKRDSDDDSDVNDQQLQRINTQKDQMYKNPEYMNDVPRNKGKGTSDDNKSNNISLADNKNKDSKANQDNLQRRKHKIKSPKNSSSKKLRNNLNTMTKEDEEEILQVFDMVNLIVRAIGLGLIISLTLAFLQSQWSRRILFSSKQIAFYQRIHMGVFNGIRTITRMIFIERSQKAQIILCLAVIDLSLFTYKNQQIKQNHRVPKWLKYL